MYFVVGSMFSLICCACADVNRASKKSTKMSSVYVPPINQNTKFLCCYSSYAVDEDQSVWTGNNLVGAHSKKDNQQPWWAVDLQNVYDVKVIDIYGLTDGRVRTANACGYIGYGYVGPVIGTSVADSNVHCALICLTKTACSAAEYDKCTNVCTLKSECMDGPKSSLFPDNNKDVFFIRMATSSTSSLK